MANSGGKGDIPDEIGTDIVDIIDIVPDVSFVVGDDGIPDITDGDVVNVIADATDIPYLHYPGDVVTVVEDVVEDASADITEDYVWDVLADIVVDLIVVFARADGSDLNPAQITSAFKEALVYLLRRGVAPSAQELVVARAHIRRRLGIRRPPK
jgi:hypothetical protein